MRGSRNRCQTLCLAASACGGTDGNSTVLRTHIQVSKGSSAISRNVTTSTSPELLDAGEVPAARALAELLAAGLPVSRISLSSDGQASLPNFDGDGRLVGMDVADVGSLLRTLAEGVLRHGLSLAAALPAVTSTPADVWGLRRKV